MLYVQFLPFIHWRLISHSRYLSSSFYIVYKILNNPTSLHPEITILRKPSLLQTLEQTVLSRGHVADKRENPCFSSLRRGGSNLGKRSKNERSSRKRGGSESTGAFDEKNIPAGSFFSFLFFFFRRDTSSMTRTEADSAQKTSLRLRARAGSRCYLVDTGRCFARCRYTVN